MVDFGFGISPSSRLDLDKIDRRSFDALASLEGEFRQCMSCGSCTAVCTAGQYKRTSLRSAIAAIQNGQEDEAVELLSSCQLCGKCAMVCPRGLNTRHIILSILQIYGKK